MNDKMIQSYNENRGQQFPFDVVIPTDEKNSKFVGTVVTHVRRRMPGGWNYLYRDQTNTILTK